jgi:hypothetical protein
MTEFTGTWVDPSEYYLSEIERLEIEIDNLTESVNNE